MILSWGCCVGKRGELNGLCLRLELSRIAIGVNPSMGAVVLEREVEIFEGSLSSMSCVKCV